MDIRRSLRRAFLTGARSVFDLSGQRTMREIHQLTAERRRLEPWSPCLGPCCAELYRVEREDA